MRKFFLLFFLTVSFFCYTLRAVPVHPSQKRVVYSDGSSLDFKAYGDEHLHWYTTLDNYRIEMNSEGYFVYVSPLKNGIYGTTGRKAHNSNVRSADEQLFLTSINKNAGVKELQESYRKALLQSGRLKSASSPFPSTGVRKNLLILATFADRAPTFTQSDFNDLMNLHNYKGVGSFKDFYLENSNGLFDITTTVTVWVTVPNGYAYYGPQNKWAEFAYDAVKAADAFVDFSQFERNGSNLYGVTIIHQGTGQETSGLPSDIWSHQGELYDYKPATSSRTFDGVVLNEYSMQPEIFDNNGSISGMGVIAHEFGHLLGLPDFYDTDYEASGGNFEGTGAWDLMAFGAYNGSYDNANPYREDAAVPSHNNPLSKEYLKWVTPVVLNSPQSVVLNPITTSQQVYKIKAATQKECFYLENRQKIGFNSRIPGHGMLVFHADSSWIEQHSPSNTINTSQHQGLYPKVAFGSTVNTVGTPFPGEGNNTILTDNTTPNMRDWSGFNTNKSITNISEDGNGVITFDFMAIQAGAPQAFSANPYNSTENRLNWTLSQASYPVIVAYSTSPILGNPTNGVSYTINDILPGGGKVIYAGNSLSFNHSGLSAGTICYYKIWSNNSLSYSSSLDAQCVVTQVVSAFPWSDPIKDNLDAWENKWQSGPGVQWVARNGGYFNHPSPVDTTDAYLGVIDTTVAAVCQFYTETSHVLLQSPTFVTEAAKNYRLSFKLIQAAFSGDQDTLRVKIRSMVDNTWTTIAVFSDDYPNWRNVDFDLPQMSEPFQLAFDAAVTNGYGIALDSVRIIEAMPLSPVGYTFNVTSGGNPIVGAKIAFRGESLTTNLSGTAVLNTLNPSRNWEYLSVTQSGFEPYSAKVYSDQSSVIDVDLLPSEASVPQDLSIVVDSNQKTQLKWNPVVDESFESYKPWGTNNIEGWTLHDFDGAMSGGFSLFDYPNDKSPSSFVVFDVSYGGINNNFKPHTGNQAAICFYSHTPPNNDWIIAPQLIVNDGDYLEFWAKSVIDDYGLETMRVLVSESTVDTTSFISLHGNTSLEIPKVWTKYTFDLSSYAGKTIYFALNCNSNDKYALMIDDVKIKNVSYTYTPLANLFSPATNTSSAQNGNIVYRILRNNILLEEINGFAKNTFTDNTVGCGSYNYALQTAYLNTYKLSDTSAVVNVETCRNVTVLVRESGVVMEGVTVTLDGVAKITDIEGKSYYKYISDANHTLSIALTGYNTLNEVVSISKDTVLVYDITPLTIVPDSPFSNVKVMPNPSNGTFILVNTDMPVPFDYAVYTIDGSLVQSGKVTQMGETKINLNGVNSGTYLMKFYWKNKEETRKVVVIR